MATLKQKAVAKDIVNNLTLDKPLTGGQIVEKNGYGVSMKKNPQVIINSDGVKEELEAMGFSTDNAKRVVAEILNNRKAKDNDRLKAADMVFDVHGDKAPDKHIVITKKIVRLDA